jgi:hypothetical protein
MKVSSLNPFPVFLPHSAPGSNPGGGGRPGSAEELTGKNRHVKEVI